MHGCAARWLNQQLLYQNNMQKIDFKKFCELSFPTKLACAQCVIFKNRVTFVLVCQHLIQVCLRDSLCFVYIREGCNMSPLFKRLIYSNRAVICILKEHSCKHQNMYRNFSIVEEYSYFLQYIPFNHQCKTEHELFILILQSAVIILGFLNSHFGIQNKAKNQTVAYLRGTLYAIILLIV